MGWWHSNNRGTLSSTSSNKWQITSTEQNASLRFSSLSFMKQTCYLSGLDITLDNKNYIRKTDFKLFHPITGSLLSGKTKEVYFIDTNLCNCLWTQNAWPRFTVMC